MSLTPKTTETTIQKTVLKLDDSDLKALLQVAGPGFPAGATNVQIYFHVPGGGDWSNQDVKISGDCPITISWQMERTSDD